jgi:hypothetical protein
MIKKILFGLALIVTVFLIVVALQPADFRIARSVLIAAPAAAVFEQVNDFHKWPAWSPWARLDPAMKSDYSGAPAGVGASYAWSGNDKVGEGRMTILESRPGGSVKIKLEFIKPFAATNTADFTFKPDGDQTNVTWTMAGTNNFMGKAFGLIMNMDKMVGGDFEMGLAQLKTVAESAQK